MLPNFLIIGSMKSGTSSLYTYLRAHPQVFMPEGKEPHYFTYGIKAGRGSDWYESRFAGAGEALAVGEASTSYSNFPLERDVPKRIAACLPDARLVYIVRQPVERMRSQWVNRVARGGETRPIDRALVEDEVYLAYSRYGLQIRQYLRFFSREQILVLKSEELRDARRETLRRVFEFLQVDPDWWSPELELEHNVSAPKRQPRATVRKIRGVGVYLTVRSRTPSPVWDPVFGILSRPIDPGSTVPSLDTRRRVESLLRDDVAEFVRLVGDGFEPWGMLERDRQPTDAA